MTLTDTILEGDCRNVLATLPDQCADLIFADPPYNLQLRDDLWRPDMTKVDAVDDRWDQFHDLAAYDQFTREWLTACRRVLKDTGTIWVMGSYHNIYRVGSILQDLGFWILNDVVWIKRNPTPQFRGVRFTNAHETLLWCKKSADQKRYTFNYQTMKQMNNEKQMRSDWSIAICNGTERLRSNGKKVHSTQKPEALLYRVILASSNPKDVVLDPFFGTGTTGAVAKKLGRHSIGIERDPHYIEAAQARIATIPAPLFPSDDTIYGDRSSRLAPPVSFAMLLEHGFLVPGQQLYFQGDIQQPATIIADGTIRLPDGQQGSIHRIGAVQGHAPTCNGWDHWWYASEAHGLRPIHHLREAIRTHEEQVGA